MQNFSDTKDQICGKTIEEIKHANDLYFVNQFFFFKFK